MEKDEQAIRDLVDTWLAASKAGDLATVLSLMADDVVFMVPGREPFGKEEFATQNRNMKNFRIEGSSEIQELEILGDWAWLRNRLRGDVHATRRKTDNAFRLHAHDSAEESRGKMAPRSRCEPSDPKG